MSTIYKIRDVVDSGIDAGILIGNGLPLKCSAAIGKPYLFDYSNLREKAFEYDHPRDESDIFDRLSTNNFERVLRHLDHESNMQNRMDLSRRIRERFIATLYNLHLAWSELQHLYDPISNELRNFKRVYTTNYDLILYWSINKNLSKGFTDRIVNNEPYEGDNGISNTHIYYLHGALHIYQIQSDKIKKIEYDPESNINILEKVREMISNQLYPLYVAEGHHADKMRQIIQNRYLNMCFRHFAQNVNIASNAIMPLFIFGHELKEEDDHLINSIRDSAVQDIYFSVHNPDKADYYCTRLSRFFPSKNIMLFDSSELFQFERNHNFIL